MVLLSITGPLGFLYALLHSLATKGFRGLGEYLLKVAISVDQLGNVMMQHLLNLLWIKRDGYQFGNRDETISSALGRNKQLASLTCIGRLTDRFLDSIDPDHSLSSIDYYIEPTIQIIDTSAWIHLAGGKILCIRSTDKGIYRIPGGKREANESDIEALYRVVKEELSVDLQLPSLDFIGVFEAQAYGQQPGILIRMTCYSSNYKGTLTPTPEIGELVWLQYADKLQVSEVDRIVFDFLRDRKKLV